MLRERVEIMINFTNTIEEYKKYAGKEKKKH